MCGIVGAASRRDIVPILVEGLRRLEYRGYDSCGLALVDKGTLDLVRTVSRVNDLAAKTKDTHGATGLAHTRW
ncbi:MAG: glutamine--fructose-6-phosphate aminotransferase, partial [Burkholderiales bacterium]